MHSMLHRTAPAAAALALLIAGLTACSSNEDSRRRLADRDATSDVWYDANGLPISRDDMKSRRDGDWFTASPETTEQHRQRMERLAEEQRQAEARKLEEQTQNADPTRQP